MSELKYRVGDVFLVPYVIVETDKSELPYHARVADELEADFGDCHTVWLEEAELVAVSEYNNPELKRTRIQKQIDDLQKQLEEIK